MTKLLAPAKVTLSLRVTGVRDDGFHLLEAEMVTVDLFDTVELVDRESVADIDESNLANRALSLVGVKHKTAKIIKAIPPMAGLGGGSADAAAVLRHFGFTDKAEAARLGADIAFCLSGGRANVSGIGEVVEPLPFEERQLTLVTPDFGCSTPEVYRAWDELGGPVGDHGNDLEPAALEFEPRLATVRDEIIDQTGIRPHLAGSGSTWFLHGAHDLSGGVVVNTLPRSDLNEDDVIAAAKRRGVL